MVKGRWENGRLICKDETLQRAVCLVNDLDLFLTGFVLHDDTDKELIQRMRLCCTKAAELHAALKEVEADLMTRRALAEHDDHAL